MTYNRLYSIFRCNVYKFVQVKFKMWVINIYNRLLSLLSLSFRHALALCEPNLFLNLLIRSFCKIFRSLRILIFDLHVQIPKLLRNILNQPILKNIHEKQFIIILIVSTSFLTYIAANVENLFAVEPFIFEIFQPHVIGLA